MTEQARLPDDRCIAGANILECLCKSRSICFGANGRIFEELSPGCFLKRFKLKVEILITSGNPGLAQQCRHSGIVSQTHRHCRIRDLDRETAI